MIHLLEALSLSLDRSIDRSTWKLPERPGITIFCLLKSLINNNNYINRS